MMTRTHIIRDLVVGAISIGVALLLLFTDTLARILAASQAAEWFGSLVAGFFFTSAFTTAPAIVALSEIAQFGSVFPTALFGALGAVLGDLVIFRLFRDDFSYHLTELLGHNRGFRRIRYLFKLKSLRWFTFLVGGLIIASPLPDELGVGLLGLARFKVRFLIPVSFIFNFIGIYAIGSVARTLL